MSKRTGSHKESSGAPSSEDELRRELEYTRDVLRRYREYVQVNYDRKLQDSADEVELMRQEVQEYQLENAELKKQVADARDGVHRAAESQDQAYKEVRQELHRVLDQHTQHVATLDSSHKAEIQKHQEKIKELEEEVRKLSTLSDPDALRREANADAQRKIAHLERQLESEKMQTAQNAQKLQTADKAKDVLQACDRQIRTALSNVHDLAMDSQETSSQLGVGLTHAGVDAAGADDLSSGWQKTLSVCKPPAEGTAMANSANPLESIGLLNQTLLGSLLEVRRAVASERSGISRGIRQLLGDKEAAEVELQRKEAVFQNELQLFQRRMTELEEDRYAEHHAANTAADRARHMDLLSDPRSAVDVNGDAGGGQQQNVSSSSTGVPSRSALMAAAVSDSNYSVVSPVSVAPHYGQQFGGGGSSSTGHRRTIACQTGVELIMPTKDAAGNSMQQDSNTNSTGNINRGSRLVSELEETQEQLTRAREVVRLLDMQRQQFMYFVEDPRLEEDIARALGAGSVSTSDFVNAAGPRFVHHTSSQAI